MVHWHNIIIIFYFALIYYTYNQWVVISMAKMSSDQRLYVVKISISFSMLYMYIVHNTLRQQYKRQRSEWHCHSARHTCAYNFTSIFNLQNQSICNILFIIQVRKNYLGIKVIFLCNDNYLILIVLFNYEIDKKPLV